MQKTNTARRFPGENSRNRPDRADHRREEAHIRQSASNLLTPSQRLAILDMKFGVGKGAKHERAKLNAMIEKSTTKSTAQATLAAHATQIETLGGQTLPDEVMQEIAALNEEGTSGKKKLKAKDRRAQAQNPGK